MGLSWPIRLRITGAVSIGVVLIGFFGWLLVTPVEPFGTVSMPTFGGGITLLFLSVFAGFFSYFISWPYGREIAVLSVPAGLAVWALKGGEVAEVIMLNPMPGQRKSIFVEFQWETFFLLAIVVAGFVGVLFGQLIFRQKIGLDRKREKPDSMHKPYLNAAVALVGSTLIAHILIRFFAQDVKVFDSKFGSVVAQPAVGQIAFAVLVSFGAAAFLFKKILNVGYIWSILATAIVTFYAFISYANQNSLQYLVNNWPAAFSPNAVSLILPVQMVAFGTLGSIIGYWLAIRYSYWRQNLV